MASAGIFHATWSDIEPIIVRNTAISNEYDTYRIYMAKKWITLKPVLPISGTLPIYVDADFTTYTEGDYVFTYHFLPICIVARKGEGRWFSVSDIPTIQKVFDGALVYNSGDSSVYNTMIGVKSVLGNPITELPNVLPDVSMSDGVFPYKGGNNRETITIDGRTYVLNNIQSSGSSNWRNLFGSGGMITQTVDDIPTITTYNWTLPDLAITPGNHAFSYGTLGRVDAILFYTNQMCLFTVGAVKKEG